nr:immunoglobulin heavy chain junction region [Mus musculus]
LTATRSSRARPHC